MRDITEVWQPLSQFFLYLCNGLATLILVAHPTQAATITSIDFLGQTIISTGTTFQSTEFGGLSGITYDANNNIYYSISDDRSEKSPARFYSLEIDLSQGKLGKVNFINVTTLLNENGQPFPTLSLDPEGITLTNKGTVFISSEGDTNRLINPFLNEFSLTGQELQKLPIPDKFLPTSPTTNRGIRNNLAFESLTITPDQKYLFTATENALFQDGQAATLSQGSPARILKYNLATGKPEQEFLYFTDAVAQAPIPSEGFNTNGLVDLLALDNNRFLGLERAFSTGVGNTIKLFEISLTDADDISTIDSLNAVNINNIKPAQKELLLDFDQLNIPLDNIEGLTFGPTLADGRRSLIIVSDNNFSSTQFTQILAFALPSNSSRSVPEPSALLGLAVTVAIGVVAQGRKQKSA